MSESKAGIQKPEAIIQKKETSSQTSEDMQEPKVVRLKSYGTQKDYKTVSTARKNSFSSKKQVSVAVDNMKLSEFITYIFSDLLDADFVIGPSISKNELQAPVTLSLQQDITEDRLFSVVTDVLARHKITISGKGDIFFLEKDTGKKRITLGVGANVQDVPDVPGEISQLVPVKYGDVLNLHDFLSRSGGGVKLQMARGENMLILTGVRDDVLRTLSMIRTLDRPAMRGKFIGSCNLEHIDTTLGIEKLKTLLRGEGIPVATNAGGNGVFFISLEKQGVLIYFAAQSKWISRLEYWIEIIDKPIKTDKKDFHVFFPKNSRASTLFESLKIMISGTSDAGPLDAATIQESPKGNKNKNTAPKNISLSAKGGDMKFSVDENRNALIIFSTPQKYAAIKTLLEKLDIMPVQVLIEASVVEITLTDKLQYGLEWYLKSSVGSTGSILKTLGGLDLGSGGLDFSLVSNSQDFKLAINAMIKNDKIKVLQNPRVTVRDGKSASIVVGTEVPVVTSEAVSADEVTNGTSDTIRSVQYRSTGVSLNVTPLVHSQGVITLEIGVEVSEAQANTTSDISSPIILNRRIVTEVVALDSQTILLGGLMKENKSDTEVKVPILGDIPYLGYLFKTTSTGGDRTELVIMITPHIIRNSFAIDEMRDAIFKSFKSIE